MIVRCEHIINPVTGEADNDHPGMRIGAEYPVLEVITTAQGVLLRIPDPADSAPGTFDSPGLWDASMFTVVSDRVPDCWVAGLDDRRLTLAPREWQRLGFWEDFFDGATTAVAEYNHCKAEILEQR